MQKTIEIEGKQIQISFSRSASHQLSNMTKPILVEMELYFSCLIRKRTRFFDEVTGESIPVLEDKLYIRFRPVMTDTCNMDSVDDAPRLTDFPIHNVQHYVPKWLRLDYRSGNWLGEFGFDTSC
ncbi:MAG: hypothetical protein OEY52_10750 [Gammaproteobacteria bacterium]|nr:hypothetical protein [Gammaproteobacteria bacterium]